IDLVADDAEFRYAQVAKALGLDPSTAGAKITCYLFADAAEKRRFTGAAQTQIAKPWRREIYLQHQPWPHGAIKHELAHALAARFGDPLFGVARHGVSFDVGLIEGVAVAAD